MSEALLLTNLLCLGGVMVALQSPKLLVGVRVPAGAPVYILFDKRPKSSPFHGDITGSNPVQDASNILCTGARGVQGNGLQTRKAVSSNLTLCSKQFGP